MRNVSTRRTVGGLSPARGGGVRVALFQRSLTCASRDSTTHQAIPKRIARSGKERNDTLTAAHRSGDNLRKSAMGLAGFKVIDAEWHVTEPAAPYKTPIHAKFL